MQIRTGAIAFGIGLAGTLDQVGMHQLLHWHHFYDRSTASLGLVSDGLMHLVSTLLLLFGGRVILREWSSGRSVRHAIVSGVLIGLGGFNLYDGIIQHKVLRLHQIRYGVDQRPYDVAFIGVAVAVLAGGLLSERRRNVAKP